MGEAVSKFKVEFLASQIFLNKFGVLFFICCWDWKAHFKVVRSHGDFLWLHSVIEENPAYAGLIIPPRCKTDPTIFSTLTLQATQTRLPSHTGEADQDGRERSQGRQGTVFKSKNSECSEWYLAQEPVTGEAGPGGRLLGCLQEDCGSTWGLSQKTRLP